MPLDIWADVTSKHCMFKGVQFRCIYSYSFTYLAPIVITIEKVNEIICISNIIQHCKINKFTSQIINVLADENLQICVTCKLEDHGSVLRTSGNLFRFQFYI